jgi:hypothetical protein
MRGMAWVAAGVLTLVVGCVSVRGPVASGGAVALGFVEAGVYVSEVDGRWTFRCSGPPGIVRCSGVITARDGGLREPTVRYPEREHRVNFTATQVTFDLAAPGGTAEASELALTSSDRCLRVDLWIEGKRAVPLQVHVGGGGAHPDTVPTDLCGGGR